VRGYFIDWGRVPFIHTAYAPVSKFESIDTRRILAEPVNGNLLFAGEAYNPSSVMTAHGAMESSELAVNYILKREERKKAG